MAVTQELEKRGRMVFQIKRKDDPQAIEELLEHIIPLTTETEEDGNEEINAAALELAKELTKTHWIIAVNLYYETRPKTIKYLQMQ